MKERRKKIEHIGEYITEQIKIRGIASLSERLVNNFVSHNKISC